MKKTMITMLLLFVLNGVIGQNKQWEVYNSIPKTKGIELKVNYRDVQHGHSDKGDKLRFVINNDYTVSLTCNAPLNLDPQGGSSIDLFISGNGLLKWQSEKMVLQLSIIESTPGGTYRYQTQHDKWYLGRVVGQQFDNYEYYFARSENQYSYSFVLEYGEDDSGGYFKLIGKDIVLKTYGAENIIYDYGNQNQVSKRAYEYETKIMIANKPIRYSSELKNASELNADNSDTYGKWQWNNDRSIIYLESMTKDAYLCIWSNNGVLSWGFILDKSATGYKTEAANEIEIAYLMLSFDGASEQSFSFARFEDSGQLVYMYVQYDRFMGTMKQDASILSQIKDKRIMMLNYKQNGSSKTAMFQLEGLEAIYNAITQ